MGTLAQILPDIAASVEQKSLPLLSGLLFAHQLMWDFVEKKKKKYLWIGGGISWKVKKKTPDILIWAPPGSIQGLSLMKGYFGKLTITACSQGSGTRSSTCGLSVFSPGEASYPCCESVIDALGLGVPSCPSRKQEGRRDSAQVFFHSPCFLTLITFCCGKEMR